MTKGGSDKRLLKNGLEDLVSRAITISRLHSLLCSYILNKRGGLVTTQVTISGQELVIGLVGAIGTDLDRVEQALERALESVAYRTKCVRLIERLGEAFPEYRIQDNTPVEDRYARKMDAGNDFRRRLKSADALALLAIAAIQDERKQANGKPDKPIERCAYILRSLKTPKEIETLRRVYGDNFLVVAAYAPKEIRKNTLIKKISESHYGPAADQFAGDANALIERDGKEHGEDFGQNVLDAFWNADVFVDANKEPEQVRAQLGRFVDLLFGHPFSTPTKDEHAMFQAHGSGLRSASAGRQVGAAITRKDGDVLATGTNEVAKAFGGQYWSGDVPDHRDHHRETDSNDDMARGMIADFLVRLKRRNWFDPQKAKLSTEELVRLVEKEVIKPLSAAEAQEEGMPSLVDKARIKHVIEYIRAVHAEMAALMSAARRGVAVEGCTLYSTTFPCHECAKHIVMAGIRRVVFIEPYPKSRVEHLYDDAIAVDPTETTTKNRVPFEPFVGIAPRRYVDLFTAPDRKFAGRTIQWDSIRKTSIPRLGGRIDSYISFERNAADAFNELISQRLASANEQGAS